ncbi:hypothetical protein DOS78_09760 [Staphylococcus felis]|uniref:hypothetical protein n=1 Tax=Staphylococcus felis TaxID=46127 RepID=UPI000E221930|nr:hypothetical protein [Staphylococcus felis]REI03297.1 hypothetical protein DOS65_05040 [Staphylococcus felis]REI11960.1 hypothetical protein DOS66_03270 [Staphylococcus felis]REI21581.1 hypothetical protein DOS78_09760 [Staphylococcus felis]
MINIISAIGSIGTFIMALFYFISVSVQLYQMKMSFLPALGFNQILMIRDGNRLTLKNATNDVKNELGDDFLKLYNLGAGAAKEIIVEIYLNGGQLLQRKYISILPSKESYLLPINRDVFNELERTIENNGYESDLQIKIMYKHNVSRKTKETVLNSQIDIFNRYNQKSIYELQFIQAEQDIKNKTTKEIQK